ncbi:VOC family protein [Nocardiopsis sp. NRRL B-16309]|uniref:VOC family protein n=1 Tax=Nocardiopsis sp. NRRL B-16309 TaxID=1519494 RepID=UPI0006AE86E0|nr:VOC family protein [Nocardiopsis sp. NRRL B-16309]KOX08798.1 glyoxalase [Nocardiopsis sp. NRRL B-16309]
MIGRLRTVAIDCPDPEALAGFYAELLGLPVIERVDDWVVLAGDDLPRIAFQRAPDHRPPAWPDPERPQQMHFDVWVDDIATAEARVLELGATRLARVEDDPDDLFRIYADPAGHPFCLEFAR